MAIGFQFNNRPRSIMGPNGAPMLLNPQTPNYTSEAALPRSIEQQGGDYDEIMGGYKKLLNNPDPESGNLMAKFNALLGGMQGGPALHNYQESEQFGKAFRNAEEIARTGGLSEADQANLRSRGTSPIRAVYQNAQRQMDRNRRLSGGSANYNAAASRMARQQSQGMADAMTNVNANIAEMVQKGKLAAMPELTRMGEGSSGRLNEVGMFNASAKNRHGENMANILSQMGSLMNSQENRKADALRGMTSLYGTTPALVETFGRQVAQNTGLNNQAMSMMRRPNRAGSAGVSLGLGGRF